MTKQTTYTSKDWNIADAFRVKCIENLHDSIDLDKQAWNESDLNKRKLIQEKSERKYNIYKELSRIADEIVDLIMES